jgi:hypothetical protein
MLILSSASNFDIPFIDMPIVPHRYLLFAQSFEVLD